MSHLYATLSDGQKDHLSKTIKEKLVRYEIMEDVHPLMQYVVYQLSKQKDQQEMTKTLDELLRGETVPFVQWLWRTVEDISKIEDLLPTFVQRSKDDSSDRRRETERNSRRDRNRSRSVSPHRRSYTDERWSRDVSNNNANTRLVARAMHEAAGNGNSGRKVVIERNSEENPLTELFLVAPEPQPMHEDVSFTVTLSSLEQDAEKKRKRVERFGADAINSSLKTTPTKRKYSQVDDYMEEYDEYDSNNNNRYNNKNKKRPMKRARIERCKYWPNCANPECAYHHPTEVCRNFPGCPFGERCLYVHPVSPVLCKFGIRCVRPACTFIHPPRVMKLCKNGFSCSNFSCRFMHPVEGCRFAMGCTRPKCPFMHAAPCRHGSACHVAGCPFAHFSDSYSQSLQDVHEPRAAENGSVNQPEQQSNGDENDTLTPVTNNTHTDIDVNVMNNADDDMEMQNNNNEDGDMKVDDVHIVNDYNYAVDISTSHYQLSASLPKTPPRTTKKEEFTTVIKIED